MFKTSLFVLLIAVSVTMVLSHPGGYGGVQESTKPVGSYSGNSFGGAGSTLGGPGGFHDDKLDGYGKPGHPGEGYNNNLRDSDSRRHYDNERRGGYDDKHQHAPGAYDNDNQHRHGYDSDRFRGGHDSDRQRGGHDSHHAPGAYDNDNYRQGYGNDRQRGHDSHHAPGAYDNDNHRRGGSSGRHESHSRESYENGRGGHSNVGSGKYSSGKPGY